MSLSLASQSTGRQQRLSSAVLQCRQSGEEVRASSRQEAWEKNCFIFLPKCTTRPVSVFRIANILLEMADYSWTISSGESGTMSRNTIEQNTVHSRCLVEDC